METLRLEKMVHGGFALARTASGRIALVKGGIPGELVEARLEERSGVLRGRIAAVLEPHPGRLPPSPHPGLDYSHMSYALQLACKREVVADALSRSLRRPVPAPPAGAPTPGETETGILASGTPEAGVPEVAAAPQAWHYRHAVQPAVTPTGLGYRLPESHDLRELDSDPVAAAAINDAWRLWCALPPERGVRELAFRSNDAGEVLLALIAERPARDYLTRAHALVEGGLRGVSLAPYDPRGRFRGGFERLAGARTLRQRFGRHDVDITATSFAQPNPAAATPLLLELQSWAGTGAAALDLYAGSGIIALHLAAGYERVTALELDRSSVTRGQQDAERLGVDNLSFVRGDAKRLEVLPEAELVAVDPPRAGLAKELRRTLDASTAERLLYVSCDVATWARDVAQFEAAGWRLARFRPYDFYPQTHHIEILSLLTR